MLLGAQPRIAVVDVGWVADGDSRFEVIDTGACDAAPVVNTQR